MGENKQRSESGQIMILLVLALVGIIAFVALAIDGAVIYSDRRIAQNAADAASLAGAGRAGEYLQWETKSSWACDTQRMYDAESIAETSAITNASINDYSIDDVISDKNGVTTTCFDTETDKYLDVYVNISDETPTSFAHLIISGPISNTVEAKTRINPRTAVAEGYNIVSLTNLCQGNEKGTVFDGGFDVILEGGVFSHSCLILTGSSGYLEADTLNWMHDDGFEYNENITMIISEAEQATDPLDISIEEPECTGTPVEPDIVDEYLAPGYYNDLSVTAAGANLNMSDGLYCFDGQFRFSGNQLTAENVTIAMVGNKGLNINGTGAVTMYPPPANCGAQGVPACPDGAIGGLLIWVDESIKFPVVIIGGSNSEVDGTIYHPGGAIEIGGTAGAESVVFGSQLIGDTVKVHGTAEVNLIYDETYFYHESTKLEVAK